MHFSDEAKMFSSLADLCYEKASMLTRIDAWTENRKRHNPSL
jgi:hypothetical protein